MLEIKNLSKVYTPKKGVPVTALDNVSLKLPERGMVFILGKSGSGKSTLLNVLGGLDEYNSGEIIIKGSSSKNFKAGDFDSYRNTYVGFIFQEYNVLDEFTVGANIALALELQGKKANDKIINDILDEVDLSGYGQRKPNELSGGQKQRVAIARALVKNPEIIMADEPTGALDSSTGKQVLDTLKKLSAEKLVIVVSHDREFAEKYSDRIIELSDGHVISDMERTGKSLSAEEKQISFDKNTVIIPEKYHLTDEDRIAINNYIDSIDNGIQLDISNKTGRNAADFSPTDETKITDNKNSQFKLIKSKLPMKSAFKIGVQGLKYKKIRLVFTIILSCVAFMMFGLADTFGSYDHIKTCTNSIIDSGITTASVCKSVKHGTGKDAWWESYGNKLAKTEMTELSKSMGTEMTGVFAPQSESNVMSFSTDIDANVKLTETDITIYPTEFTGFCEINSDVLENSGYKMVAGNLPDGKKNEVAVSELVYETFHAAGYNNGKSIEKISSYNDLIGKKLTLLDSDYTICGVVDTNFDINRYIGLAKENKDKSTTDDIVNMALMNEYSSDVKYGFAGLAMVGNGGVDKLVGKTVATSNFPDYYVSVYSDDAEGVAVYPDRMTTLSNVIEINADAITWVDGVKTTLADNEILLSSDIFSDYGMTDTDAIAEYLSESPQLNFDLYNTTTSERESIKNTKIVGVVDSQKANIVGTIIASQSITDKCSLDLDGIYSFAVGPMPSTYNDIHRLVSYCYNEESNVRYGLQNPVTYELDAVHSILESVSNVFLWIGLGFAAFAGLMLANFIGTSISYKKQEIGILRAVGSRSSDVFRIFFSESFVIAMINFVLSFAGVLTATIVINYVLRKTCGILITMLSFGIRQVVLLLLLSVAIAAISSFIPIKRIASKNPIDAIRSR